MSQARAAVRSRMEAGGIVLEGQPVALRWQNETGAPLPDAPAPFVYTEILNDGATLAGFGGGRGSNLYRNRAFVEAYVFVPVGWGLDAAEAIAEQIAVLFRSYRDTEISCFEATVIPGGDGSTLKPPGLASEVGQYFWCGCEIRLHFDQVG
jgi:hypothetical protein